MFLNSLAKIYTKKIVLFRWIGTQIEWCFFSLFFSFDFRRCLLLSIRQDGVRIHTERCLINLIFDRSNETKNNVIYI